jgi:hypothetical protein
MTLQVEYNDDTAVIPKSSSVLVRRVPNLPPAQLTFQQPATAAQTSSAEPSGNGAPATPPPGNGGGEDDFGGDLYSEQRDEDTALTELLNQTGKNWQVRLCLLSLRPYSRLVIFWLVRIRIGDLHMKYHVLKRGASKF